MGVDGRMVVLVVVEEGGGVAEGVRMQNNGRSLGPLRSDLCSKRSSFSIIIRPQNQYPPHPPLKFFFRSPSISNCISIFYSKCIIRNNTPVSTFAVITAKQEASHPTAAGCNQFQMRGAIKVYQAQYQHA
ncbi:hypothetical protein C0Q70_17762 [Pomacea canaliculata]|uniref:Uncharacterized protein n=1 Tax=Pomacea canaliculata TaxID=400727 RepID=A0A2T7NLB7_POMCA|nr:hypothetical protein C0Q70_17762 [Pomacea canaliculata]